MSRLDGSIFFPVPTLLRQMTTTHCQLLRLPQEIIISAIEILPYNDILRLSEVSLDSTYMSATLLIVCLRHVSRYID